MKELTVAVTGASGFIGRYVLAELARHKVEVTAVIRHAAKLVNVGKDVRVVEFNIGESYADGYEKLHRPDVLIHLAWDGLPNYKSLHHFETELPGQYSFLKGLIRDGLPALLVTGTCFEYGMQSGELSEDLIPLPNNPYAYAKDALRRQLAFLQSQQPFALTWTRLFYMYGDGQCGTSLYPKLKEAVLRGDRVFNMSGGEQLRDYLPVTRVAALIVALALRQADIGIVNVCSGKPVSVRDLVENWLRDNGWQIELNLGYYPYPDYEPMEFWGSPSKLLSYLPQSCTAEKEAHNESKDTT